VTGRVVAVTGGAGGIGLAVCRAFAALGDDVAVLDVDGEAAERAARQLAAAGVRSWYAPCDTADEDQVRASFTALSETLGRPDVLVNNAGFNHHMLPFEVDLEVWSRLLAVNVTGYLLCAREAAAHMRHSGGGAIVNVSSIAGSSGLGRGNLAYSVSKSGVEALTRELAIEWAQYGIRVTAVAPCQVATEQFVAVTDQLAAAGDRTATDYLRGIPMGRAARPEEIASAVTFLASEGAAMVSGSVLAVDGANLALNAGGSIGGR
jgi:NAD(P)-dependent dehydrogenase (short-subunit alcohol dehydrogenase family)